MFGFLQINMRIQLFQLHFYNPYMGWGSSVLPMKHIHTNSHTELSSSVEKSFCALDVRFNKSNFTSSLSTQTHKNRQTNTHTRHKINRHTHTHTQTHRAQFKCREIICALNVHVNSKVTSSLKCAIMKLRRNKRPVNSRVMA